eukprot:gene25992-31821_t
MSAAWEYRQYDVVVWGATGYTGQICANYLADTYGCASDKLSWAIAGRNEEKLAYVKDSLGSRFQGLDVLIGDGGDEETLDLITRRTKAVITTAGPYSKYGNALVDSCVRNGTHYCDLTGETGWVKSNIEKQ